MKIKTTTSKANFKKCMNFIVKNRLCLKSGEIRKLQNKTENIEAIGIAFKNNKEPLGCCVSYKNGAYGFNFSVFVLNKYRRKGIGSELAKRVLKRVPFKRLKVCKNVNTQKSFYESLDM